MFKLDNNLLIELGLGGLLPDEKNKMLAHIYETLEMRVGMKLAEQMTNEQLDEFEGFIDRNDEAGALKWLESNFPHYKQVVADELDALKKEIKAVAPQIVAASQQNAALAQQQQQLHQSQPYQPAPSQPMPQAPAAMPPMPGQPQSMPPQPQPQYQTPPMPPSWPPADPQQQPPAAQPPYPGV